MATLPETARTETSARIWWLLGFRADDAEALPIIEEEAWRMSIMAGYRNTETETETEVERYGRKYGGSADKGGEGDGE